MAAPAWLADAMKSEESGDVPTCSQFQNGQLGTDLQSESLIDKGLAGSVPTVPSKKHSFQQIAAERKRFFSADDRVTCCTCQNFTHSGICIAARPGGPVSAQKGYRPAGADMPQRCEGFEAKPLKGAPRLHGSGNK